MNPGIEMRGRAAIGSMDVRKVVTNKKNRTHGQNSHKQHG